MQLSTYLVVMAVTMPYTLAISPFVRVPKLLGKTGEDSKDSYLGSEATATPIPVAPARDLVAASLPVTDMSSVGNVISTIPATDRPASSTIPRDQPSLPTVSLKDLISSYMAMPSISAKDLTTSSSSTTVAAEDLSTTAPILLTIPAKDQTNTLWISAKGLPTSITELAISSSVPLKDQTPAVLAKDQTSTVSYHDQGTTTPAKDLSIMAITTTTIPSSSVPSTTKASSTLVSAKDLTSAPVPDLTSAGLPGSETVVKILAAMSQSTLIVITTGTDTGLVLSSSRSTAANVNTILSTDIQSSSELPALPLASAASTIPPTTGFIVRPTNIVFVTDLPVRSTFSLSSYSSPPETFGDVLTLTLSPETSTSAYNSASASSSPIPASALVPFDSSLSDSLSTMGISTSTPTSGETSDTPVVATEERVTIASTTVISPVVAASSAVLMATAQDSTTTEPSLSSAVLDYFSLPTINEPSLSSPSAAEATGGTFDSIAQDSVSMVPSASSKETLGPQAATVAVTSQASAQLGSMPTTTTIISSSYSTTSSTVPNVSGAVLPLWVPAMLGNAYGGGFIQTPSIYVMVTASPSIGIPPGYGYSLKPGQSTPVLGLSIVANPRATVASGGYLTASQGVFGSPSIVPGGQMIPTYLGNGSYAVPTASMVFEGLATKQNLVTVSILGVLLMTLMLL